MKLNRKGFLMTEVIVVTTIIITFSIGLYSFTNTTIKYNEVRNRYNSPNALFKAANIKGYFYKFNKYSQIFNLITNDQPMHDIKIDDDNYYSNLINDLGVKDIYISKYNVNDIIEMTAFKSLPTDLQYFIKWIANGKVDFNKYRLIISFNNGDFTTIEMMNP